MPRPLRRTRGALLRLVLRRPVALTLGLALLLPALWLGVADYRWETAATDGGALVVGATGAALLAAGLSGRRGDWIEPDA